MESIENYKKRFFNLMESTIGDVRPLITEQLSPDKIREYKAKWEFANKMDDAEGKEMYQSAINDKREIVGKENRYTVDYFNDKRNEKYISQLVTMYDMSHNPKSSELGKSPITNPQELTGDELTKFYNAMLKTYEKTSDFDGRVIFSTLLNNRDNKIPVKTIQDYINQETGKNYNLIDMYNKLTDKEGLAMSGQNIRKK